MQQYQQPFYPQQAGAYPAQYIPPGQYPQNVPPQQNPPPSFGANNPFVQPPPPQGVGNPAFLASPMQAPFPGTAQVPPQHPPQHPPPHLAPQHPPQHVASQPMPPQTQTLPPAAVPQLPLSPRDQPPQPTHVSPRQHADPELEMAMNHILMKLSADLRDVSSGLGAHAKYLDDLQQWSSEADETIKRERLQRAAFEDQLQKLQEALKKEWEMRVHAEDQLKAANDRIAHLEEKIKKGFQAYEALSQENMRLSSALQLARNSTTMTAEELREQKARRERLENMLHEATRRNMTEEDIIKMLENALIDETDKEFVKLLKTQIEERKKLVQEHMDVYLAYRLQHGELAEEEKRKKKQQEDQDLAFARQLQAQENTGRPGAKPAAAAAPRAYPYAAYQVNPYQNQYIYTYPTTASTTSNARPTQPQKKGGGYQKF